MACVRMACAHPRRRAPPRSDTRNDSSTTLKPAPQSHTTRTRRPEHTHIHVPTAHSSLSTGDHRHTCPTQCWCAVPTPLVLQSHPSPVPDSGHAPPPLALRRETFNPPPRFPAPRRRPLSYSHSHTNHSFHLHEPCHTLPLALESLEDVLPLVVVSRPLAALLVVLLVVVEI